MNKSKVYLILVGVITALIVWDMADSFFGGLGFPRGDWEAYTWQLPFVLIVLVILLQGENDKNE